MALDRRRGPSPVGIRERSRMDRLSLFSTTTTFSQLPWLNSSPPSRNLPVPRQVRCPQSYSCTPPAIISFNNEGFRRASLLSLNFPNIFGYRQVIHNHLSSPHLLPPSCQHTTTTYWITAMALIRVSQIPPSVCS